MCAHQPRSRPEPEIVEFRGLNELERTAKPGKHMAPTPYGGQVQVWKPIKPLYGPNINVFRFPPSPSAGVHFPIKTVTAMATHHGSRVRAG